MTPKEHLRLTKMEGGDLLPVLERLSKSEQIRISQIAMDFEQRVKSRKDGKVFFGYLSALELVAKIGIWMGEQ